MADLPGLLAQRLQQFPDIRRWVIAFSGGLDSRVLLELCARTQPADTLLALHVNHALQDAADEWARHCESVCLTLGVPFAGIRVDPGSGSEADLREARYGAFSSVLSAGDGLLLAHHADDQAETLLLRLLRGAGLRGLAGMPPQRLIGGALLYRPLLDQPRAGLERWARTQGLQWIEDPSNTEESYDRNWLRHRVLAPLTERWPQLPQRVTAATGHLAESAMLLDEIAAEDLAGFQRWPERMPMAPLALLSGPRRRNVLRHWVHGQSGHWLAGGELLRLEQELIGARGDGAPALKAGRCWLRRYREEIYILPEPAEPAPPQTLVATEGILALPQGTLTLSAGSAGGLARGRQLRLDYRRGGEQLRPLGRGGSVSLKQLLQEAGVPPWWRGDWPLLFDSDEIVAVPGICLCEGAAEAGGLTPLWQPFGLSEPGPFGRL